MKKEGGEGLEDGFCSKSLIIYRRENIEKILKMRGFRGQEFLMCSFITSQVPPAKLVKKQTDVLSRMINSKIPLENSTVHKER